MDLLKVGGTLLALGLAVSNAYAAEPSKGKVLVVMSSAKVLDLKDGKKYDTGYYLNELATPLKAIVDAGYTPVFADPLGNEPQMDASSNNDMFFDKDAVDRELVTAQQPFSDHEFGQKLVTALNAKSH